MIKSVRLVNFFSFGDCTIDLESDLNVLVGINGSGKSNFLRAFQLLKAGMDSKMQGQIAQWGGINSLLSKNVSIKSGAEIELIFSISSPILEIWSDGHNENINYRISLVPMINNDFKVREMVYSSGGTIYFDSMSGMDTRFVNEEEDSIERHELREGKELNLSLVRRSAKFSEENRRNISIIYSLLSDLDIYKSFNTIDDAPMRTTVRATGVEKLLSNGDNMFQVLNVTGLKSTIAYDAIESGLHDVNEHFQRFRMNVYGQGSIEFYLQEKGLETPIHASQISDGTLCYLCLLVALYQPDRGNIILFDEPERNLHPDMLFELGKQLEKASATSQIILATHAPGLLNYFPLRAVRVFEKDENNQTIVKKFTEEDFAGWYDEFAPGQMWRNGALGGNRY